ncbi:hypothetical protein ABL840_09705 [Variovorax sp. NFACC27]|uniref:hypothetical protein n=1 Tax=unclassified Variovorax TaxID=663243 RepID=UPI000B86EC02|nr:hypothetical protein [Variovorax sp. YR750]
MPTAEQLHQANNDVLVACEELLKSAIMIREMAIKERDKHSKASAEWERLNDLLTNADSQVFGARASLAEAQARIAAEQ